MSPAIPNAVSSPYRDTQQDGRPISYRSVASPVPLNLMPFRWHGNSHTLIRISVCAIRRRLAWVKSRKLPIFFISAAALVLPRVRVACPRAHANDVPVFVSVAAAVVIFGVAPFAIVAKISGLGVGVSDVPTPCLACSANILNRRIRIRSRGTTLPPHVSTCAAALGHPFGGAALSPIGRVRRVAGAGSVERAHVAPGLDPRIGHAIRVETYAITCCTSAVIGAGCRGRGWRWGRGWRRGRRRECWRRGRRRCWCRPCATVRYASLH